MSLVLLSAFCATIFLIALGGTWLARRYALRRQLVDQPGARRSHAVATPRGGGIAIVVAVLFGILATSWSQPDAAPLLLLAALGLVCVAGIGWIDDHRPLSPWLRLAVHAFAAVMLGLGVWSVGASPWLAVIASALALGLVNVWNFMDGIDGLATTQAVLLATGAAVLASTSSALLIALAVIAASLGFLPFNAPRARIFLGDVGSGAIGYLAALLCALLLVAEPKRGVLLLIPVSAFMIDAALTLASRMLRREQWWRPHVQHVYQQSVQRGHPHMQVTAVYLAWTMLALWLMVLSRNQSLPFIIGVSATWYALAAAFWIWMRFRHRRWMTANTRMGFDD